MGASGWDYYVPYQPDRYAAFVGLRQRVFESGEFWWAVPGEPGKMARDYPNRPQTEDELWSEESVRLAGTHSILDMYRVLNDDEKPNYGWLPFAYETFEEYMALVNEHGNPDYGIIAPLTEAEAIAVTGSAKLTHDHVEKITELAQYRGIGRCVVLHDPDGTPAELYFWGYSGD
ncbi:hypothetical protein [Paractinoplanes durhamensis]|uniref:Uncharacterized protein n=1 Tax=Paractinoplanes durhamensis TaxID=113563 RepID=A0ABQ3YTZ6_9ACTN|nr:hypothetical protein [Actinoplanes durhamensis]GIE01048.1 hypothetical protein Adu01nite_23980 [Actinoplanes durhamensis]